MIIKSAAFVTSSSKVAQCPTAHKPEIAFIGRSNVGKSSLINMLLGRKDLAKTSSKPGKTKLINHFIINDKWYLVDLPGYGYAKVSKQQHAEINQIISQYLKQRENILCLLVLIDLRLPPQPIDLRFMEFLGRNGVPFAIVFTKSDKLSKRAIQDNTACYMQEISSMWEPLPAHFITSATKATGREAVLNFIDSALQLNETKR